MSDNLPTLPPEQSLALLYQLAHSDIRWAKERASLTMYWIIALQVGSLALHLPTPITTVVIVAATLFASVHLLDLHRFGVEHRRVTDDIAQRMEGVASLFPGRAADSNHVVYLCLQVGAMLVGAAVSIWTALTR
jgi:hypothetical protein